MLVPRVALGALLVIFGAATGRAWLVPVAVWIALPVVWINAWVILLASIRLYRQPRPTSATAGRAHVEASVGGGTIAGLRGDSADRTV